MLAISEAAFDFASDFAFQTIDQLSSDAVDSANSKADVLQSNYTANIDNYSATPPGIEAGMSAQNRIKKTKFLGPQEGSGV